MKKASDILLRYGLATIGLLFVALGVALGIISNLGTSPLSAPGYVLSASGSLSVGNWTIIVNMCYMMAQFVLLRKNFKISYLMQIPASFVFGYLIDFCIFCLQWLNAGTLAARIIISLLACLATALGVSIEVVAKGWMLSAEMTVFAITQTFKKPFDKVKIAMDCSMLIVSAIISAILFSNPFGYGNFEGLTGVLLGSSKGVVIGLGTGLLAVLSGGLMRFTDPLADKLMDFALDKFIYNRSNR